MPEEAAALTVEDRREALRAKRAKLLEVQAEAVVDTAARSEELDIVAIEREEAAIEADLAYEDIKKRVLEDAKNQREARARGEEYVSQVYDPVIPLEDRVDEEINTPPDNSSVEQTPVTQTTSGYSVPSTSAGASTPPPVTDTDDTDGE